MSDRERWKTLLPIIEAYAAGKDIELLVDGHWITSNSSCLNFNGPVHEYRIKQEPTYRPFANAAEFAPHRDRWMKRKDDKHADYFFRVTRYHNEGVLINGTSFTYDILLETSVFDDGSPFGVRVE